MESKRSASPQTLFDFDAADVAALVEVVPQLTPTLRMRYVEQLLRDLAVLREDVAYHVPDTAFFEARVTMFRDALSSCGD